MTRPAAAVRFFENLEGRRLMSAVSCCDLMTTPMSADASAILDMPMEQAVTRMQPMTRGNILWAGVMGEWKGTVRVSAAGRTIKLPVVFDLMPRSSNTVNASVTIAGRTFGGAMKVTGTNSSFTATYSRSGITAKISGSADSTLEHIKGTMRASLAGQSINGKLAVDRVF